MIKLSSAGSSVKLEMSIVRIKEKSFSWVLLCCPGIFAIFFVFLHIST